MPSALDELIARVAGLSPQDKREILEATRDRCWVPNFGPQTEAMFCLADVLAYGGQGGGGKSHLLLGLAFTEHRRSLLMRRRYGDLSALTEEAIRINGTRDGYNGSAPPKLRTRDGRLIEFGAAHAPGSEQSWQGQPHDFLGVDEAVQFLEKQIRFLMGWVRSIDVNQRKRTILASNPPITAEGQWIVGMFRPWLDITHHAPALPGELRWFITDDDGKDYEVPGPEPVEQGGRVLIPQSRTFIPAALADNPYLIDTGYQAQLDALPEPLRSAVRDGNFMAARTDDVNQCIPTAWVIEAQNRWQPNPPAGVPMCAIGVDVASGGKDQTVLSPRYDGWFAELIAVAGRDTPTGSAVAGLVVTHRRNAAFVIIDLGGGYGGSAFEHLRDNAAPDDRSKIVGHKGAEASTKRTVDRQLGFVNKRSEVHWKFREALDPGQQGGSPIMLPHDPELVADLTAPRFEITGRGIKVESKEDVVERLGRSPDKGDAVTIAWSAGPTYVSDGQAWKRSIPFNTGSGRGPAVILGHESARRRR